MKNWVVLIALISISLLLLGCTQNTSPDALLALDKDKNITLNDTNLIDSNSNVFNNLDDFKKAKIGDNVSVDYTGRLTDGTIFDSSVGREPLEFDVGAGQMIKGFDDGVVGMKVGETKFVTIPPEQAYGLVDSKKIITVDKNSFSQFDEMQVGLMVSAGNGLTGIIIAKNDTNATIDFNHKLAGKTLIFEITLISINN
jgi:peptidylprolyl isomerase